jgi:hypothetical protein
MVCTALSCPRRPLCHHSILTHTRGAPSLIAMSFAGRVLIAVLSVALAGYALDCVGMTTPEQAMRCCNSMRCSLHARHSEDCCKSMPSVHATFGQPPSVQGVSFSPIALGIVHALDQCDTCASSSRLIAEHAHAPPFLDSPVPLPLRI